MKHHFDLIHDGTDLAWQTAYLAYHLAARTAAHLAVALINNTGDRKTLEQRAVEIEVGGRAAGVTIESRILPRFSFDEAIRTSAYSDGIIIPRHLVPEDKLTYPSIKRASCPLWIISDGSDHPEWAILVDEFRENEHFINYAVQISRRLKATLHGIFRNKELPNLPDTDMPWHSLPDFSTGSIEAILHRIDANLLFLPATTVPLMATTQISMVVDPSS